MAMNINTNVVSINAQRNMGMSQGALAVAMQRLSSGLRVNSAKDDAAGLAIAERMRGQTQGLTVAARNTNDGISLAQTTEGALGKVGDMLQRARELAVQSANASNSDSDRQALQAEVSQLLAEVDRVAKTTTFNGRHVLNGQFSGAYFQVGANAGDNITVALMQNTTLVALSDVVYGASTSGPIQVQNMGGYGLAIADGALTMRVGDRPVFNLGPIAAASSGQERLGQVVAAINAKTPDTGVTAYLEGDVQSGYTVQIRSASDDAVALMGFSLGITGMGQPDPKVGLDTRPGLVHGAAPGDLPTPGGSGDPSQVEIYSTVAMFWPTILGITLSNQTQPNYGFIDENTGQWDPQGPVNSFIDTYPGFKENFSAQALDVVTQAIHGFAASLQPYVNFETASQKYTLDFEAARGTVEQGWKDIGQALDAMAFVQSTINQREVVQALDVVMAESATGLAAAWSSVATSGSLFTLNEALEAFGGTAITGLNFSNPPTAEELHAARNQILSQVDLFTSGGLGVQVSEIEVRQGLEAINIDTQAGAWEAIARIDSAIDQVNSARAYLGALQTRFEKTVENINIQNENITAARGRIVDTDFAVETANLSRAQILQQAGTAMVAQANQLPQNVLSLLR